MKFQLFTHSLPSSQPAGRLVFPILLPYRSFQLWRKHYKSWPLCIKVVHNGHSRRLIALPVCCRTCSALLGFLKNFSPTSSKQPLSFQGKNAWLAAYSKFTFSSPSLTARVRSQSSELACPAGYSHFIPTRRLRMCYTATNRLSKEQNDSWW